MKQKKITLKLFDIFALVTVLIGISIALMFVFQKQNYIRVTVKVAERDVLYNDRNSPSWFSHFFQKGMVEKDSSGRKVAEIN
ncbi:hypothetical protein HN682_07155, partial [Candidatus Peregrinibacteria bacterium]|nr:hypothetical protein [Candidatus Peregrinibacteria bacterium]